MNWAYLAGFTDGDGCIALQTKKDKYVFVRIRWSQKESESQVLDEIQKFFIEQGIPCSDRKFSVSLNGHKFPQRELGLTNNVVVRQVLKEMLPYLILKKEKAEYALTILDAVAEAKAKYGWQYKRHLELA